VNRVRHLNKRLKVLWDWTPEDLFKYKFLTVLYIFLSTLDSTLKFLPLKIASVCCCFLLFLENVCQLHCPLIWNVQIKTWVPINLTYNFIKQFFWKNRDFDTYDFKQDILTKVLQICMILLMLINTHIVLHQMYSYGSLLRL